MKPLLIAAAIAGLTAAAVLPSFAQTSPATPMPMMTPPPMMTPIPLATNPPMPSAPATMAPLGTPPTPAP
jgi:hypothetical protein